MQMILGARLARSLGGPRVDLGDNLLRRRPSRSASTAAQQQKERFLPQIAAGKLRAAIAFTEPGGGTDVLGALRTEARPRRRRLDHQRREDLELVRARGGLPAAARAHGQGRGKAPSGRDAVLGAGQVARRAK